jgi:hypothetical protein
VIRRQETVSLCLSASAAKGEVAASPVALGRHLPALTDLRMTLLRTRGAHSRQSQLLIEKRGLSIRYYGDGWRGKKVRRSKWEAHGRDAFGLRWTDCRLPVIACFPAQRHAVATRRRHADEERGDPQRVLTCCHQRIDRGVVIRYFQIRACGSWFGGSKPRRPERGGSTDSDSSRRHSGKT